MTELTGTREIEERLHGMDGVKDEHTQIELARDDEGERERVETPCGQLGSLLREQRETLCPLEAGHDQVDSVVLREFEGMSAANGCTRSLGGMEAPGALVEVRIPSVSVPVCVFKCVLQRTHSTGERRCVRGATSMSETPCVKETPCVNETPGMSEPPCVSGVVTSVPWCVLPSTPGVSGSPCMSETPRVSVTACVSGMVCARETARVSERPSVRGTACVRSLCVREMTVGMREHAAASPGVNLMEWCVSVVTRRCAWVEWRRLRRQMDKGRVAAVVALGTAPGLHGGEREVRAVQRTRTPRARLRE